jgi:hypothetical protein
MPLVHFRYVLRSSDCRVRGGEGEERSDVYALGVVGYFAATGGEPFEVETVEEVAARQVDEPAPPLPAGDDEWRAPVNCMRWLYGTRYVVGSALTGATPQRER